uniref:Pecanex-like protein n=1 Tax=Hydatigena taeniaeformis TaxID=6205 RepID=A0A0R3WVP1_HYDTA
LATRMGGCSGRLDDSFGSNASATAANSSTVDSLPWCLPHLAPLYSCPIHSAPFILQCTTAATTTFSVIHAIVPPLTRLLLLMYDCPAYTSLLFGYLMGIVLVASPKWNE